MMHALDDARTRIDRAREHREAFSADAQAFLRAHPSRFDSKVYAGQWWVKPHATAPPPLRLGAIVADLVANARGALDALAVGLAEVSFSPALDLISGHDRRVATFPVFAESATSRTYRRWRQRLAARGVPAAALAALDASQPDVSGDPALGWLHYLERQARHRALVLTIGHGREALIEVEGYRPQTLSLRTPLIASGVVVPAPADLVAAVANSHARVQVRATVSVTWVDPALPHGPIEPTLERMIVAVDEVIDRFASFF